MKGLTVGVQIAEATVPTAVDAILRAEELGIDAAWLTGGGFQSHPVAVLALAAARTHRIKLGTAIVPIYPQHPFALAQMAKAVAELAPGRFRLGVGPSHKPPVEENWGIPFRKPLGHLREYITILKAALQRGGPVEYHGQFYRVRGDWGPPVGVPVMASALQQGSFTLAGEVADGAISWVCPFPYIQRVALPALSTGAAQAGRPRPKMVMHLPVCVHDDAQEVHEAALARFTYQPRLPFYRQMFVAAGFPEAAQGVMSDAMLRAIVLSGDEDSVVEGLREIAASGVDEVLCTILPAGADRRASAQRTLELLAEVARAD